MRQAMPDLERSIARCRVLLSLVAIVAVWLDPTEPVVVSWLSGGPLRIDPAALAVLGAHLAYSLSAHALLGRPRVPGPSFVAVTTWADVVFGAAIAAVTEGTASPFFAFFGFAVVAAGLRGGLRPGMMVTAASVALYLTLMFVASRRLAVKAYMMRPVYLAILGYLTAYLGERRLELEAELRGAARAREREEIARALHDGCVQTLAGTNLTLKTCRELVRRDRPDDALAALADLEDSFSREYQGLRRYVRALADLELTPAAPPVEQGTRFTVQAEFAGSAHLVDHVAQIVREAVANVQRHAGARTVSIRVGGRDGALEIALDDDGVGLPEESELPWTIASRVRELGGRVVRTTDGRPGAHLVIAVPQT